MKEIKKAMAFDDMPEKGSDTPDESSGSPEMVAHESAESPEYEGKEEAAGGEGEGSETAVLSTEMLGGQDLKPGSEVRLRIVSVSPEDGTVTVSAGGGDKGIAKASKTYDLKGEI